MKIISWNVQGAKKMQVLQEVKLLSRTHKPDMIFFLETMVNEKNITESYIQWDTIMLIMYFPSIIRVVLQ